MMDKSDFGFQIGNTLNFTFSLGSAVPPSPPIIKMPIVECTQEQYDAMKTHDSDTLYAISREVT